ncbi:hypothetical protein J2T57_001296 [Natronocella acetinitrilica]|uniref:Uncharacterized protein n=1 Tax=Natronocella acetinitrilica TaxID=414046 RepID=A0AAE3KAZ9_9GAMM|nr:hypothetical protein [Natronocella acetinitrilica]MCP1674194.1 hypothetical protein [Natronocella acetinitrilica]
MDMLTDWREALEQTLDCLGDVIEPGRPGSTRRIVLIGSMAMAAHGLPEVPGDVDLFIPGIEGPRAAALAERLRRALNAAGRRDIDFDLAPDDYCYGPLRVPDAGSEPGSMLVAAIHRGGEALEVRAPALPTLLCRLLVLLRDKDHARIERLSAVVGLDALIERYNAIAAANPPEAVGFYTPDFIAESLLVYASDEAAYRAGLKTWMGALALDPVSMIEVAAAFDTIPAETMDWSVDAAQPQQENRAGAGGPGGPDF